MKKHVLMTAVLSLIAVSAFAQNSVDVEVDQEIDQMYRARTAPQRGAPVQSQPVYIVNQATPTATAGALANQQQYQVQKQPTTYIEAAPLTKSRAEQIREARQQVEAETETKIVEKLEHSRMEDEKRRANVLFGEQFNSLGQQQQAPPPVQPVVVAPAPAPVAVAPAPAPEEDTREVVREEIRAALEEKKEEPTSKKFFTGLMGVGDYPDVKNVRGNYLLGASFGTKFDDTYAVEGAFIYSNYTVQKLDGYPYWAVDQYGNQILVPPLVDVQQYAASLAVKYYMLSGMVRPILGGLAQYSYRTFSWSSENYGQQTRGSSNDASSHAIDLGLVTGVDFEFTPKFTLGLDFRYMFNMNSRITTNNNSYFLTDSSFGTPIEKLQYYNLSLAARVAF